MTFESLRQALYLAVSEPEPQIEQPGRPGREKLSIEEIQTLFRPDFEHRRAQLQCVVNDRPTRDSSSGCCKKERRSNQPSGR